MTHICRSCRRPYTQKVPVAWAAKYPELKELCPECVGNWVSEHEEVEE